MNYRPEIDGLRTFAIIPVVLFHLKIQTSSGYFLPGGFLGVDVFFVISGFLITSILLSEDATTGHISILRFYKRRARRILPALLLVIFASLIAGWNILLPSELERLALSALAALAFVSNAFWFVELGAYGAQSGLLQPLLHTWSLAIEEQFYLLFPLLLLVLKPSRRPKLTLVSLITVGLASLLICQITTLSNKDLSFYSPLSRTWELLIGALTALLLKWRPDVSTRYDLLSVVVPKIALATLVGSMFVVRLPEVNHPGLVTLPTVLATAALICFTGGTGRNELVTQALSWQPMVYIGKLSYSIYLWHFPVFAFGRLLNVGQPDAATMAIWVALTMALSVAGYHLIERPFRFNLSPRRFFGAMAASVTTLALACAFVFAYDHNARGRMQELAKVYGKNEIDNEVLRKETWKQLRLAAGSDNPDLRLVELERKTLWFQSDTKTKLLVIGNSHSKGLLLALNSSDTIANEFEVARFGIDTVFPEEQLAELFASPNFKHTDWVLISTRYGPAFGKHVPELVAAIKGQGKSVAIVGNTAEFDWPGNLPIFDWYLRTYGSDTELSEMSSIAWNAVPKRINAMNSRLRQIAREEEVPFLSRADLVCDSALQRCDLATDEGLKTMYDYGHWTLDGAAYFGQRAAASDWLSPLRNSMQQSASDKQRDGQSF